MFCSSCGNNNVDGAAFCNGCGAAQNQSGGVAPTMPADAQNPMPGQPPAGAPGQGMQGQPQAPSYQTPGYVQPNAYGQQPNAYGQQPMYGQPTEITGTSGMAIAGFVLSFFCGLLGLIFSIIGYNECKASNGTVGGEGLALAGIIISIVSMLLGLAIVAAGG